MIAAAMLFINPCSSWFVGPEPMRATTRSSEGRICLGSARVLAYPPA
jgi:hypothetical protein